jgi:putative endonuclease
MSNKRKNVLYIGVTNNLVRPVYEHENSLINGFTKKYRAHDLVYFEESESVEAAISREKELKSWKRCRKDELIRSKNPELRRLNDEIY